jgi:hypothetical protein
MKAQMYNYSSWINETNPTILFDKYMLLLNKSGFGVLEVIKKTFSTDGIYGVVFIK